MKSVAYYLWTASLFFIPSLNSAAQETIRITNGEWAPFYSENLPYHGLDSRIVSEAFALEDVNVIYDFFPWKRSYEISKHGVWDGTIGWPYNKERAQFHYFSKQPINKGEWVFFYRNDASFDWDNIDNLKNVVFGVTLGDWVMDGDDKFTTALREEKLNYDTTATDEQNFLKLNAKRIDIFPQQLDVGYAQLKKLVSDNRLTAEQASRITHHPEPFRLMPLYLLLSKKHEHNKQMIERFDNGFEQLKESGRYEQFINESRQR
jgi:polar amino acid transport system substrate-binding protein